MDGGANQNSERNGSKRRQKPSDQEPDNEAPKTKRQRVSRACDKCRLCRDKCDGKAPCYTCVVNGRECTYATSPKKRGIQPGYIRTLELSLSLLINRDFEAQKHLLTQLSSSRSALRQSVSLKDANQPDDLLSRWTSSSVCKQIESLLSGSLEDDLPLPDLTTPPSNPDIATRQDTSDPPSNLTVSPELQLPTNFWSLLDHYYAYTHNWLPISEKNEILKTAYSYPINESDIQNSTELGRHAELWAIIALTTQQKGGSRASIATAIAATRRLIPNNVSILDTSHIRALLLLAVSNFASGDRLSAWVDIGTAVRILTFFLTRGSEDLRFRHLILACHVVEHLIAAHLDQRPHLTKAVLGHMDSVNEDGLEEWSPWQPLAGDEGALLQQSSRQPGRSLSGFNALVKVCGTLYDPSVSRSVGPHVAAYDSWTKSIPPSAIRTPQQLHLDIIHAWVQFRRGALARADFEQTLSFSMSLFKNCGGQGAIPPTLIPIVGEVFSSKDSMQSRSGAPVASPLYQLWKGMEQRQFGTVNDDSYSSIQQPGAVMVPRDVSQTPMMASAYPTTHQDQRQQHIETWANNIPQYPAGDSTALPAGSINQDTPSGISEGGGITSDFEAIFEEMAQLDGTRQANDSSLFMQNLGIGPESDLRAFFGADYQETDPLLAYLQFDRTQVGPGFPS